jgi:hypothetical protein
MRGSARKAAAFGPSNQRARKPRISRPAWPTHAKADLHTKFTPPTVEITADLIVLGGRSSTARFDSILGPLRSAAARRIPDHARVVPGLIDGNADLLGAVEAALAQVRETIVRDVRSGATPIAPRDDLDPYFGRALR